MPSAEHLFFALWPPEETRGALVALQRDLPADGRATHPLDIHLTLVFMGHLAAGARACAERVAEGVRAAPFDLAIDQVGYWVRPHILWGGPATTPAPLARLVKDLQDGLARCGLEPERRPYAAHVTLYRKARPASFRPLDRPIPWPVREFVLARSGRAPQAPRYEILRRWPLAATDPCPEPPGVG